MSTAMHGSDAGQIPLQRQSNMDPLCWITTEGTQCDDNGTAESFSTRPPDTIPCPGNELSLAKM